MTLLSRDLILARRPRRYEDVPVPELGENGAVIRIAELTSKQREEFEAAISNGEGKVDWHGLREQLVLRAVVDEELELLFQPEDVDELSGLPATVIERLFATAQQLSGFGQGELDELVKN